MPTTQVKSNLAKLLATENLTVEHRKVSTASFNVETRVLYLPIWEEITNNVYDLLVGHEVGHAIYTPNWDFHNTGVPQSFVNVVEDARIERKMKIKYPGLVKSFFAGYKELNARDFFEINEIDLDEMNFIDRINLYFKIGLHDVSTLIPFHNPEETRLVKRVAETDTFEDVLDLCKDIVEYVENNKKKEETNFGTEIDPSISGDPTMEASGEDKEEDKNEDETESESKLEENERPNIGQDDTDYEDQFEDDGDDEFESKTDEAWGRNQQQLISNDGKDHVYISPPSVNWDDYIQNVDEFSKIMEGMLSSIDMDIKTRGVNIPYMKECVDEWTSSFTQFKVDSKKAVSYLVKEFEMKKKASEYSREQVNKTGVINTNKLFSYKWTDDIFLKKTVVPTGKNHGLIMYIDWSGSMHENIEGAVKQLINLISFCKKVSIPCQVFAFTDTRHYDVYEDYQVKLDNEIVVPNNFQLVELYSSKIKHSDFDRHLFRIWVLMKSLVRRSHYCPYSLGSTPLNESILAAPYIFKKFKSAHKVDKVNTVFLTDGESNYPVIGRRRDLEDEERSYLSRKSLAYNYYESVMCFKDPKSGYSMIDIGKGTNWQSRGYAITTAFIKYYKWITGSNVIGFRLSQPSDIKHIIRATNKNDNTYRREWSKNKHFIIDCLGYNELYVLESSSDFNGEKAVIQAENGATKSRIRNQFKKYMKTKMFNKIILSKFVAQIA